MKLFTVLVSFVAVFVAGGCVDGAAKSAAKNTMKTLGELSKKEIAD